ncbi:MAG: methyltransferase domain-containing protein [Anaerolineales bacterium]|nr:methyltransferase domain-containing protein [Anaerolineales bacterium]
MDNVTIFRLLDLNYQFYQIFAQQFSATRGRLQPGVRRVLETLRGDENILDLGCGNGELARALARREHRGSYTGLDFSLPLLEEAGRALPDRFRFVEADLTQLPVISDQLSVNNDWSLITGHWSLITAFAVLHHIPGTHLRLRLLNKVHSLLAEGGRFVHSEWQFLNSSRLRERIQDWGQIGLSAADVDSNDYLLDWRRGGRGLRYVHHFDEAELNALAAASRFKVRETFRSDGEGGKLALYQLWEGV